MINKENKEKTLAEIILDGEASYGDIQLYMDVHKLDKLELTDDILICKDKIGKLCVKIYDEDEGTADLMGLDMWMAINKSNQKVGNEVGKVSKLHKIFNKKNLLKLLWIVGLIVVLINLGSIDAVSFILGELFGIIFVFIDKLSDKKEKVEVKKWF